MTFPKSITLGKTEKTQKKMKTTLALITHGFEEIEAVAPIDLLRRANVQVTVAALGVAPDLLVRSRGGVALRADVAFEKIAPKPTEFGELAEKYDALLLPGGPGSFDLRKDGRAVNLASEFAARGKIVAAICAAPLILKSAGLLDGRRASAHSCAWSEIPAANCAARVTRDGNIITSRGPATAFDFGLALVTALCGNAVAEEIAGDTMA